MIRSWLGDKLPLVKENLFLKYFGVAYIPLLNHVGVSVVELSDDHAVVRIPFKRRNKNHLGGVYLAAQATGADVACGVLALRYTRERGIQPIFKDFSAEFLKRPLGPMHLRCDAGAKIKETVMKVKETGERHEIKVEVTATVPSSSQPTELVSRFWLTLSLK